MVKDEVELTALEEHLLWCASAWSGQRLLRSTWLPCAPQPANEPRSSGFIEGGLTSPPPEAMRPGDRRNGSGENLRSARDFHSKLASQRGQLKRNSGQWRAVGKFLQAQRNPCCSTIARSTRRYTTVSSHSSWKHVASTSLVASS